jgi:aspartate/methionine/tyrosine aminotransferase
MSSTNKSREAMGSSYMHWAKTASQTRFNLSASGLANLSVRDLRVSLDDLEITGEDGYGYEPLKQSLATRYHVDTSSIVTAAGTSFANHLAMAALVNPGDEVLIEQPVYEPLLAIARYLRADIKQFSRSFEHGFQLLPEEIERNVSPRTRLIVITNLHNPSGILAPETILRQVGQIASRVNARVLVDEVYVETLFEDSPRTAFHLGNEFVVTSSLTKAFGLSGLRCGWIFAGAELAKRMWLLNDIFAATPVHAGERLSVLAFQQIEEIARRAHDLLDRNRRLLNEFLDSRNDLETIRPEFGTIMFPRWKGGNTDKLCAVLQDKYETSVVPGRFFGMPAHFRVGLGGDSEVLETGLERLGTALDETSLG